MSHPLLGPALGSLFHGTPYQYQRESTDFLLSAEYGLSADEMGLGKTLEGILVAVAHTIANPKARVVVVCPRVLKINWAREFEAWAPQLTTLWAKTGAKLPREWGDLNVLVINYEQMKHAGALLAGAEVVIADECHYLLNLHAQRTQLFHYTVATRKPKRLVLLSGTPIKNRVSELYSILVLCGMRPRDTNGKRIIEKFPSVKDFCEHFCHKRPVKILGRPGFQYVGLKNEAELDGYLERKVIRHLVADCIDLPPVTRSVLEVELPDVEEMFDEELAEEWEALQAGRRTQFLAAKKTACAIWKVPATVEHVENILECAGGPVVVFTDHVDSANLLHKAFLAGKRRSAVVHGGIRADLRQRAVDDFQMAALDVLVATTGTLQAGVTLTRGNRLVYNDLPWEPSALEQSAKRIHRIGQERPCFVDIIAMTGMDAIISRTLSTKMRTINKILGNIERDFQ